MRRLAADIHRTAERLDRRVEEMLDGNAADGAGVAVALEVPPAEGAVVAARGTY